MWTYEPKIGVNAFSKWDLCFVSHCTRCPYLVAFSRNEIILLSGGNVCHSVPIAMKLSYHCSYAVDVLRSCRCLNVGLELRLDRL